MDNDTISRQAAISFIENVPYIKDHQSMGDLIKAWLEQIPAVQPEQKIGRWFDIGSMSCRCSECGCKNNRESRYCPNCGAKMESEG